MSEKTTVVLPSRPKETFGQPVIKFCTGGYKKTIIGTTVKSDRPVWAVRRVDKNPVLEADRIFYCLMTTDYPTTVRKIRFKKDFPPFKKDDESEGWIHKEKSGFFYLPSSRSPTKQTILIAQCDEIADFV